MGLTLTWLSVIILIPLAALFLKTFELSFDQFWGIVTSRRTLNALKKLFAQKGWLGAPLAELGIKVAFAPTGIFIAMVFIGIPFVVRTVQPVLIDLDPEIEEAAASLGANRWHTVFRVILPGLVPALLTGFALAFARAVGEYGSALFLPRHLPTAPSSAPLLYSSPRS